MAESDNKSSVEVDDNKDSLVAQFVPKSAILDGKFFTVVQVDREGIKIKARCNTCTTKTVISGSSNALSNFTTHLKVGLSTSSHTTLQ
jgi:hypothetical protein